MKSLSSRRRWRASSAPRCRSPTSRWPARTTSANCCGRVLRGGRRPNARDAALISTLWSSGARRSELANLRLQDLDLETMTIVIVKSKAGWPRRAPIDQRATQHLLRWLAKRATYPVDGGELLWVGKNGPLTSDGIRQVLERRRKEAGVNISAHAFRRGFAAHAVRNGVSQTSLMVAAGSSTPTTPNRICTQGASGKM